MLPAAPAGVSEGEGRGSVHRLLRRDRRPGRRERKVRPKKTTRENIPKSPERASDPTTHFPWCPRRLRPPPPPTLSPPAAGKHRTQSSPEAFQWDGTGNICGLKERGTGREMGVGGGEGRGHKPEAHKRFIVAVGSRWGGPEGPACSEQSASWLKRRPRPRWEEGARRPTVRPRGGRRRTEHL